MTPRKYIKNFKVYTEGSQIQSIHEHLIRTTKEKKTQIRLKKYHYERICTTHTTKVKTD